VVTSIANSAANTATGVALSADQVTNFKVKVRILAESYQDLLEGKGENYSPFRPGMTATVDIITRRKDKAIGVPISSIVIKTDTTGAKPRAVAKDSEEAKIKAKTEQKFECVFIKSGDKAKLRVVTTGIQDDTNIEVTSGLKKGDVIIVGP